MNAFLLILLLLLGSNVIGLSQDETLYVSNKADSFMIVMERYNRADMNYQDSLFNRSVIRQIQEKGCSLYKETIYNELISNKGVRHLSKELLTEDMCVEEILAELNLSMNVVEAIRSRDRINYPVSMVVRELSVGKKAYKTVSDYIYSSDYIFNWDNELKRTTNKTIIRHLLRDFLLKDPERLRRERKRFSLFFNRKHHHRLKIIEGIMAAN